MAEWALAAKLKGTTFSTAETSMVPSSKLLFIFLVAVTMLVGCGSDSGLQSLQDFELAERQANCLDREPTAPGRVQACKNIARECERRKKDLGLYICRSQ